MFYKGNDYNLEGYFNLKMKEDGFVDDTVEKEDDIALINKLGYMPGDFIEDEE